MRNKIISTILSLCALLASVSCEKNLGNDGLLPDANLSIRLYVDGPVLTKTASSATVADIESESAISSLTICLVKEDGLVATSPVVTIDSKKVAWKSVSDGVYEVNAVIPETCTGDYLLYVIANKPQWMAKPLTYADICGTFSGTAAQMALCWADDNFLMVNEQNDITTSADQAGVPITMAPLNEDEKVEATVTIERLASKVLVDKNPYMKVAPLLTQVLCSGENPGVDPDIKGAIVAMSIVGYSQFNSVNSFNLVQRWNGASGSGDAEQLLVTPSSSKSYDMSAGYYDNVPSELVFKDLGTTFYCMENNSPYYTDLVSVTGDASPGTKMKGRVTGLVFKAKAGFAKNFSGHVTINDPLDVEDVDVVWTKGGSEVFYSTLYQYKGDYYGDISCLLRNNSVTLSGLTTSSTVEQLRDAGVKVYENGEMYYNYWIQDVNYTDGGKNYLSVMRNTFYDITITAINSMGDEFPCGGDSYDPEDPISVDVPKLSVSFDIPDWVKKEGNYTIQ